MPQLAVDQTVGNVGGLERVVGARSVRKLRSPSASTSATSRPVSCFGSPAVGDPDRLEPRRFALDVRLSRRAPRSRRSRRRRRAMPPDWLPTAGPNRDRGAPVRAARERPFRPHDDVGHHVADGRKESREAITAARPAPGRTTKVRSSSSNFIRDCTAAEAFLEGCDIGGLLGARAQGAHPGRSGRPPPRKRDCRLRLRTHRRAVHGAREPRGDGPPRFRARGAP